MQRGNLFMTQDNTNDSIRIKIFCDESATVEPPWLYFGLLLVPEFSEEALLQEILNRRCHSPSRQGNWGTCQPACLRHAKNDTEVHFKEIRPSKKYIYEVADRWLAYFLEEIDKVYLYVLGVDLTRLDKRCFGDDRVRDNIYNRFFRSALLVSAKSFFSAYDTIHVTKIVHDENPSLEDHPFFTWHTASTINEHDPRLRCEDVRVQFLDSDHRVSTDPHSHFIQFVDLILNCVRCCRDYSPDSNELKTALVLKSHELVKRLIKSPSNVRSSYKYVGRLKIQFFPRHDVKSLNEGSLVYELKRFDSLYTNRELRIENRGQLLLF